MFRLQSSSRLSGGHRYNEAMSIRKTYEQIITRLKEEATTYTPEMEQLDVMQAAKEGDSKQLMLMVKEKLVGTVKGAVISALGSGTRRATQ